MATAMTKTEMKDSHVAILIAAIQNSVGPVQVDAEKVAKQLGMSLSTIPPMFSRLRKQYNIDIKLLNSGALQRHRGGSPKKAKRRSTPEDSKGAGLLDWPEGPNLPRSATEMGPTFKNEHDQGFSMGNFHN